MISQDGIILLVRRDRLEAEEVPSRCDGKLHDTSRLPGAERQAGCRPNSQTLLQKMKRGLCDYDLVEVMACPSGCLNGGGQVSTCSSHLPLHLARASGCAAQAGAAC